MIRYDISDFVPVITEKTVKSNISQRFKKRRKEFGLSQKELSKQSGVSYGSIRRFETSGEISLQSLLKISSVIGLLEELNDLFKNPIVKDIRT
ncbi:MAG: helix-turn-helix transcriptional regulator [Tenericutes bacterium]|jgi:transcriptional regulator with XRE-family HTH domain|nr:helix-turn-helix transcriptional regulator [Mycoplasmatota bacterium]